MKTTRIYLSEQALRKIKPGWTVNLQSDPLAGRFHNFVGTFKGFTEKQGAVSMLILDDDGIEIRFPREKLNFAMRIRP